MQSALKPIAAPRRREIRRGPKIDKIQYGGLEYNFTARVSEKLMCSICFKPLLEPHLTICCGQHFCEMCLQSAFLAQRTEKCPHCRAEGEEFQHVLDKKLRREIDSLQIFCPNKSMGCEWMGEVRSLKKHHSDSCDFVEVDCPNQCKIGKIQRKELDSHLKKDCENRPSMCQYCGHRDTYKSFKGENGHYSVCPEVMIECPNNCGVKNLKRKDLKQHQQDHCLRKMVKCPFDDVGCGVPLMQHDLTQHMLTHQQQHLVLLMSSYKEVKQELQATSEELHRHIIRDAETKQALVLDLKFLRASLATQSSEHSEFALASIQTRIGEVSYNCLKRKDDRLAFRMLNFSHHASSGKVWQSPPFYYEDGYKMRLAAHPNPLKSSKKAQANVVLFLHLIRGEYDSELKWPIQSNFDLKISILDQQAASKPSAGSAISARVEFCPRCNNLERFNRLGKNESSKEVEILGSFPVEDDIEVINDSIVLSATVTMHQHSYSF